jgi:sugar lactone lactonase YvrE
MKERSKEARVTSLIVLALVMFCLLPTSIRAHSGSGIAVDGRGQVYFLDTGSGLWKIDTQGRVTHLSETRFHWLALDTDNVFGKGRLPSSAGSGLDWEIVKVGIDPTILLASDWPIAIGHDGNLYYQSGSPGHLRIMRSSPSGTTEVFANLPAMTSGQPLPHVSGLTAGPGGSLYYTEANAIRRITSRGLVGTVVTVPARVGGPSIPGTPQHPYLRDIVVDADGTMYVADNGDARVLKITPRGKITTLVQTQSPWSPTGVALFGGDVYVLEYLHTERDVRRDWLPRVRKITPDGKSTIIVTVDQMPGAR